MNKRERILALTVLGVVILAGGGFLFKFLFLDALSGIQAQIDDAEKDIEAKKIELKKEGEEVQAIQRRDPRLLQWQRLSLPEDKDEAQEIKNGHTPEEAKKRHADIVQVEYEQFLRDLVVASGFAQNSIKISASTDRKTGPILTGKTPAYTKMTFTVQGQAGFDSVVRMLEDFYHAPLLHEVRSLTLTTRQQTRTPQAGGFANRGGPGGFGAAPGGPPAGGQPGGFPGGGFPGGGARPGGGFPGGGFPGGGQPGGGQPGGFPGGGNAPGGLGAALGAIPGLSTGRVGAGDLDVNMTVEALLVTGADKRDSLKPEGSVTARALADPARTYTDMLAKNIFTGIAAETKMKEDPAQVLSAVKLTAVWYNGRRWQATFYDQGKPPDPQAGIREGHLRPPVLDEFSVTDRYDNVLVRGKVVKLDEDGVVFKADDKYYRWQVGQFLGAVMDAPLKSSELRELGIKVADAQPSE